MIDEALLSALRAHPNNVIVADNGLPTRFTQMAWLLELEGEALCVTPKALHGTVIRAMDAPEFRNKNGPTLCSPQLLLSHRPTLTKRVMLEMSDMGVIQKNFIRRCRDERVSLTVRCLHMKLSMLMEFAKPLGFTFISYRLKWNGQKPETSVRVHE